MTKFSFGAMALLSATLLAGCVDGVHQYSGDPNTVIAASTDTGRDPGPLEPGRAAIGYDPDGCQVWIIDDGVEGYSGRRFDPSTGLPICNNHYAPGTVVKDYQSQSPGVADYTPNVARRR